MSTAITPRLGASIIYTLNQGDADVIVQRRRVAGTGTKSGNDPRPGESYPGIIVRDFALSSDERARLWDKTDNGDYAPESDGTPEGDREREEMIARQLKTIETSQENASVNIQVFLDGDDTYWATSRSMFSTDPANGHGRWVQVIEGIAENERGEQFATRTDAELPKGYSRTWAEGATEPDPIPSDIQWRPDRRGHWMMADNLRATIKEHGSEVIADTDIPD